MLIVTTIRRFFPEAKILAFGSRVRGNAQPYSDLDIAVDIGKPLDFTTLAQIRECFAESTLTYKVDIVDLRAVDKLFLGLIKTHAVSW